MVWNKCESVENLSAKEFRKDIYGNIIKKDQYGKRNKLGWTIDHIQPLARGGSRDPDNLQALQHEENTAKGNQYPYNPATPAGVTTISQAITCLRLDE